MSMACGLIAAELHKRVLKVRRHPAVDAETTSVHMWCVDTCLPSTQEAKVTFSVEVLHFGLTIARTLAVPTSAE